MITPKLDFELIWQKAITLKNLIMPYTTRSYTVIDFFVPIVCHVIQREYRYNMVSIDVGVVCKVIFFDSKVVTKIPDSTICLGEGHQSLLCCFD